VESCFVLDVNYLSAQGWLEPGWMGQWVPDDALATASLILRVETGLTGHLQHGAERFLRLSWHHLDPGEEQKHDRTQYGGGEREGAQGGGVQEGNQEGMPETIIPIVDLPWRFGGTRPYFLCPETGAGGCCCGRRVIKLYLSRPYQFLCRQCSRLLYTSQYEQPWQRALKRANKRAAKLWRRLGSAGTFGGAVSGPDPAYARLLEEALQAETQAYEAGTARLQQLAARIESRHKPQFTL
jgi:hypothetical protein